jgi:hypothetical protein
MKGQRVSKICRNCFLTTEIEAVANCEQPAIKSGEQKELGHH